MLSPPMQWRQRGWRDRMALRSIFVQSAYNPRRHVVLKRRSATAIWFHFRLGLGAQKLTTISLMSGISQPLKTFQPSRESFSATAVEHSSSDVVDALAASEYGDEDQESLLVCSL